MSDVLGGDGLERRCKRLWEGREGSPEAAGQEPGCLGLVSLERCLWLHEEHGPVRNPDKTKGQSWGHGGPFGGRGSKEVEVLWGPDTF